MGAAGRLLMAVGGVLLLSGAVLSLLHRLGLRRLPGDVVLHRAGFTFVLPLATSLLVSLLLSLLFYVIGRR